MGRVIMIMMIEGRMIGGWNVRTSRGRYWVYLCMYSSFPLDHGYQPLAKTIAVQLKKFYVRAI